MENRLYAFDWKYIGDMELGRPNLGKTARLEIYRLFQYTLRDVLETEYGTEQSDRLLYKAGFLAGTEFSYVPFAEFCPSGIPRWDRILQTVRRRMRIIQRFRR